MAPAELFLAASNLVREAVTESSSQDTIPVTKSLNFEQVYAQHVKAVATWVRALGADNRDVDDWTQEVFLVVREKIAQFEGSDLRPWLFRIARNVVSDQRRRAWFRRVVRWSDESLEAVPTEMDSPSDSYERREAERILQQVLAKMSDSHRSTFILFEVEGYSGEDIAALEGIPINTVYTRLHHARKHFLRLVAESAALPLPRRADSEDSP